MAHAQKPDFVFRRNGPVHLNRRGRQFNRLLAAEVCASAVVMLDTPCSEVVCRVLATHSFRQFPLHFPSRASRCAITFQLDSTCLFIFCWPHTDHILLTDCGPAHRRVCFQFREFQKFVSTGLNFQTRWISLYGEVKHTASKRRH